MNKRFMHPDFFESLDRFYPGKCDIKEYTETRAANNEVIKEWKDKHKAVNCAIGTTERLSKRDDSTPQEATNMIILTGSYTDINKGDRVETDSELFEIMEAKNDNMGVLTQLMAKKIRLK